MCNDRDLFLSSQCHFLYGINNANGYLLTEGYLKLACGCSGMLGGTFIPCCRVFLSIVEYEKELSSIVKHEKVLYK